MKRIIFLLLLGLSLAATDNLNAQKSLCEHISGGTGAALGGAIGGAKGGAIGYVVGELGGALCRDAREMREAKEAYDRQRRENEAGRPKESPGMTREQIEATRREQRLESAYWDRH